VLCNAILFYAAYVLAKAARVLEMRQVVPMTPSLSHQCYSLPLSLCSFYAFYVITPKSFLFLRFSVSSVNLDSFFIWFYGLPNPIPISTPSSFSHFLWKFRYERELCDLCASCLKPDYPIRVSPFYRRRTSAYEEDGPQLERKIYFFIYFMRNWFTWVAKWVVILSVMEKYYYKKGSP